MLLDKSSEEAGTSGLNSRDEEAGPSRKKAKLDDGNSDGKKKRKRYKNKPKMSCIPHPSTLAWLVEIYKVGRMVVVSMLPHAEIG